MMGLFPTGEHPQLRGDQFDLVITAEPSVQRLVPDKATHVVNLSDTGYRRPALEWNRCHHHDVETGTEEIEWRNAG
jgi:hypothetical protein